MRWSTILLGLIAVLSLGAPYAANGEPVSSAREDFLRKLDSAFSARASTRIAALADTKSWHEAGYPDVRTLKLVMPPGPLVRKRDLGDTSVLYQDPSGRSWQVTLERDEEHDAWRAVIRQNLCPRGGGMRARPGTLREAPKPAVETWTIFECYPLPM
jgi:hypothetical protein